MTAAAATTGMACLSQGALDWAAAASVAAAKGRLGLREARRGGAPAPLSLIAAYRTATPHRQQGIGLTQALHF